MSYDTQAPYIASYVLIRKDNKVAFVLRSNTGWMNGYYGLPSGKVEKQESFTEAAVREALEEIGVKVGPKDLRFVHVMHRVNKGEGTEWVDVCFEAIKWDGEPHNAEPHVHGELAWLEPGNLPKNVVPSVRYLIEQIEAGELFSEYFGV